MADARDDIGGEVHRLLDAVQEWAKRFPEATQGGSEGHARAGECLPWCPICQFAQLLRGDHPEVTERLTEAATAVASAMKALADTALTRAQTETGARPRPQPAPRVQRITLDDPADP
ncbi:MAG: hypothetical protein QOJ34_1025 [Pseudonocardiales bacterium]|jgi:hypothetical protein|nr:hypothetical protein [Pseudonocardiales bacterium]